MSIRISGSPKRHSIFLYSDVAIALATPGVSMNIPWNREGANPPKVGIIHSTTVNPHLSTIDRAGRYQITGLITIPQSSSGLDSVDVIIDAGGQAREQCAIGAGAVGVLDPASGKAAGKIGLTLDLAAGHTVAARAIPNAAAVTLPGGPLLLWMQIVEIQA